MQKDGLFDHLIPKIVPKADSKNRANIQALRSSSCRASLVCGLLAGHSTCFLHALWVCLVPSVPVLTQWQRMRHLHVALRAPGLDHSPSVAPASPGPAVLLP